MTWIRDFTNLDVKTYLWFRSSFWLPVGNWTMWERQA